MTLIADVNGIESKVETITNQKGDEIINKAVSFIPQEKIFYFERLNCLSSKNIDNGICQCINHETYLTDVMNIEEAIEELDSDDLEWVLEKLLKK